MKLFRFSFVVAVAGFLAAAWFSSDVQASDWIGGNSAIYSVTVPPDAIGWSGGVPNGVGAVAQKIDNVSGTVVVDIGGVTLGTIRMGGPSPNAFGITPTSGLTLDQDGAGPGFAVIENTNTAVGSTAVVLNAGTITLADDLLIRNASNTTRTTGSIIATAVLAGNGNVTMENNNNTFPASSSSYVGALRLAGANTFTGSVLVKSGLVTFGTATPFGSAANPVTLGQAGQGGVTVVSTSVGSIIANPITVAAGTGGDTILGSNGAVTSLTSFTGPITLNGNLQTTSASTSTTFSLTLSGAISGAGGIRHAPNAGGTGWITLSGANSYTGKTSIASGTMRVNSINSVVGGTATSNMGAPTTVANGTIDIGSGTAAGTILYQGGGETTDRVINLTGTTGGATFTNNGGGPVVFTSDLSVTGVGNKTLTLSGTQVGNNTFAGVIADGSPSSLVSLTKSAVGRWVLTNANTYSGNTTLNASGGSLVIRNGQAIPDGVGKGNVNLGTSTSLILDSNHSEAINGLDGAGEISTTAAVTSPVTLTLGGNSPVATHTHTGVITNTGAGALSVVKKGLATQVFSGTKSYSGTTTIQEGVLRYTVATAIAGAGENVTVNFGGAAATSITGGIDQAFLNRIVDSSTGIVALSVDSANNLDFNAANLANVSLGASGSSYTYSGVLTPHGTTFRLGGGGPAGQLTVSSALTGAGYSLVVGGNGLTTENKVALSGVNSYDGTTTVVGGTLRVANQVSLYNNTPASWTAANIIVEPGTTMAFNVGGIGQFTVGEFAGFTDLGTAGGGFKNGSSIGIDTTNATGDTTIPDVIDNPNAGANALGFTKLGTNNVVLTGANSYTGPTAIENGALSVSSINSVGGGTATSNLGAPTTVAGGTIHLGLGTTNGTLIYTGAGETTDRVLNFAATTGDGVVVANGTGPVSFTGALTATGLGNKVFQLQGTNTGDNTITSTIGNLNNSSTTGAGVTKSGTGTWVLAGDNIYSGDTTVQGGTLKITGTHIVTPLNTTPAYNVAISNDQVATVEFHGGPSDSISGLQELKVGGGSGATATGGIGTFVQMGGTININSSLATTRELNIGESSTTSATNNPTGVYDLQAGTLNLDGNAYLGRTGGTGTFHNAGTVNATGEFRVGHDGSGTVIASSIATGTFNNLAGATLNTRTLQVGTGTVSTATPPAVGAESTGTVNQLTTGTINVTEVMYVGDTGTGTFNQAGGTVTVGGNFFFGNLVGVAGPTPATPVTSNGTFNLSGGTASAGGDFAIGFEGTGTLNMTGGTITTTGPSGFIIAREPGSTGTATISAGTVLATGTASDLRVGMYGTGVLTQTGGSMSSQDWMYIGTNSPSNGTYNISGGTCSPGDNMAIGFNAGTTGAVNMTGGTITILGNEPNYTGNLVVARNGTGTLNISTGTIDLVVGPTPTITFPLGTNNSASFSVANNTGGPGHELDLAQDGNLIVGETLGNGTVTQTGGLIRVAANIFAGGSGGGSGSITISGGQMLVGMTSPSGGDVVLGGFGGSGTINLQGGLLDVSHGSGKFGGSLGTASFSFTGGTLKVKEYNVTDFGGSLGGLMQTGATSVLDVTGNNTTLNGGYALTDGTLLAARQVTVNGDVNLSSSGEFQWQLGALSTSNPGVDFGQITLTGDLALGGTSKLELDFGLLGVNGPNSTHTFWDTNRSWKIVDTTTNNASANFATLINPMFTGGSFALSLGTGADLGDIFLNFTASATNHPGDFDSDGDVDGADFVAWQTNFPKATGATLAQGDADGDGDVDGADFVVWQTNFPFTPGPGASPVPEPTTFALAAISAIGLLALRRRK